MGTLVATQAEDEDRRSSRRRLLKSALRLSVVAGGIIVLGAAARVAEPNPPLKAAPQVLPPVGAGGASGGSIRVKVMYFQMRQVVANATQDHFVLESPAYFRDLLNNVVEKHPLLSTMTPTMMILVDGVPGQPGTQLRDGDEVDLIPSMAGG
jgi:molybdopterin converting factor small subunit